MIETVSGSLKRPLDLESTPRTRLLAMVNNSPLTIDPAGITIQQAAESTGLSVHTLRYTNELAS